MRDFIHLALPWQRYDTAAIQLGALQAKLQEDGFWADTRHFYKDLIDYVRPDVYMRIFEAYMGEPAFAAILYPERHHAISQAVKAVLDFDLVAEEQSSASLKHPQLNANLSYAERSQLKEAAIKENKGKNLSQEPLDFDYLIKALQKFLDDVFNAVNWENYKVIGFTTSHQQFIPTIILARRIKKAFPEKPIVIGGALMVKEIPTAVLELFDVIDFVISGEGEITLSELLAILTKRASGELQDIAGLTWRHYSSDGVKIVTNCPRQPIADLDSLPIPNYDDYFAHPLKKNSSEVMPKLTVEASRACVWGRCIYCNLNLQWGGGYRRKSHVRVVKELDELCRRYKSNIITFCDTNVVDKIPLFEMLAHESVDYRILAEVSPHITREGMRSLREGGVRTVQVGIESFSPKILKLYRRGHTVIRSLEVLKWAAEFDVEVYYNLIINFPMEEPSDVEQSLRIVEYAQHFMYPAIHDFSLTMDSPAYNEMDKYNIVGWKLPDDIAAIYPSEVGSRLAQLFALTIKPIPRIDNGVDWAPLLQYVDKWKKRYHGNLGRPGIVYLDGGSFLNVSIRGGGVGNDICISLADEYREIYLACVKSAQNLNEICSVVPNIPRQQIAEILEELDDLKILFTDGERHLALGIREKNLGNYPISDSLTTFGSSIEDVDVEPCELRSKRIINPIRR